jgi:hypothetical protein
LGPRPQSLLSRGPPAPLLAHQQPPHTQQGGDFIHTTKNMTGAKVAVDRQMPGAHIDERVVHVSGFDECVCGASSECRVLSGVFDE